MLFRECLLVKKLFELSIFVEEKISAGPFFSFPQSRKLPAWQPQLQLNQYSDRAQPGYIISGGLRVYYQCLEDSFELW
jgi:hypothetical protein